MCSKGWIDDQVLIELCLHYILVWDAIGVYMDIFLLFSLRFCCCCWIIDINVCERCVVERHGNEAGGNYACVCKLQVDIHERRNCFCFLDMNTNCHVEKRVKCVKLIKSRFNGIKDKVVNLLNRIIYRDNIK